jgi:ABC-type uncharacterized transport system substrate-binding protein
VEHSLYKILVVLVLTLAASPAMAHPHIFAKYDVVVSQKDKDTIGIHFTFKVHNVVVPHPLFQDQQIDSLFDALHQHPFLLFLDLDGRTVGQQDVELARAGGTEDEPIYTFDMDVPAGTSFGLSIYDPEYYDAISLAGADAITIKVENLVCAASSEDVGHTMWGVNHASHVECGDKSKPLPQINSLKKNRFEHPDFGTVPTNKQMLLP